MDDDSSSSSSSDDDEKTEINHITSYRGNLNGSSKPKSQRINADEAFNKPINFANTDVQMELVNSNDFKEPSDDSNWADFGQFNSQVSEDLNFESTKIKRYKLNYFR